MYKNYSFRRKNKEIARAKSKKGVRAKARKKTEALAPEFPVEITDNWITVRIQRCINGHIHTEEYFGDALALNSYAIWDDRKEHVGNMSLRLAALDAVGRFPAIRHMA